MYTLLLAIIYLVFISLGLPDSLLGSAWPTMRVAFDMPLSSAGIISMIIAGGTICSSLASERLIRRFTTRWVTVISVFLTAIALSGFSLATRFWMLCLWAIPYGLGAGCIDSAMNNYVALHYRSRHMSWLHCFWGVGTIISPYIMSWCITHTRWNDGYRAVSFLQFGIAAVLLLTLPIWKIHAEGGSESSGEAPLGVDVERVKPRRTGLPRYVLSDREFQWFAARGSRWGFWTWSTGKPSDGSSAACL